MFFLLRVAFWLIVLLALLPSGGSRPGAQAAKFGTGDAVVAASAAVSDMSNFCERQPSACEVGANAAVVIGQRAQAGAKMIYEFINERINERASHEDETGSATRTSAEYAVPTMPSSQNTLTPSDLEPAWQGVPTRTETVPVPLPPPRPRLTPRIKA
jgi:hypothetical protein